MRVPVAIAAAAAAALVAGAACTSSPSQVGGAVVPSLSPAGQPLTYVAVGASETVGIGTTDPLRAAWPQVFYRAALPRAATFVNLGVPGITVSEAIQQELPEALNLHPDVVTVWLNVNDILHGVSPQAYEVELQDLLGRLRSGGTTQVLVANTPPLDDLPAYLRCAPYAPGTFGGCDFTYRIPPALVRSVVDQFNEAIIRAAGATGAVVVDLYSLGIQARRDGTEDRLVAPDGFHPSDAGAEAVARAFAGAWRHLSVGSP